MVQSDLALGTESVHLEDVFAFAKLKIVIYLIYVCDWYDDVGLSLFGKRSLASV